VIHGVHSHIYLFSILEGVKIDWPIINAFETHVVGLCPTEVPLLDPKSQIKRAGRHYVTPFQFIYMGFELWANYMG
jgi:hypothetical protein